MEYNIRTLEKSEYPLRKEFLYEAIFVPEGVEPPPRAILEAPELQVYIAGLEGKKMTEPLPWRQMAG